MEGTFIWSKHEGMERIEVGLDNWQQGYHTADNCTVLIVFDQHEK